MDVRVFEHQAACCGYRCIAGIDEAGRGPLAGPVVAAAVVLPPDFHHPLVTDSKKLTPASRNRMYDLIYERALTVGIGIVDAIEIDRINILRASLLAMSIAADNLAPAPDYLLIDGICRVPSSLPQKLITEGDLLSISISAASIVAKVTRDRLMDVYDWHYPQFGFARHKGYATEEHREAIRTFGCSRIHRRTFKGVGEPFEPLFGAWHAGPTPATR